MKMKWQVVLVMAATGYSVTAMSGAVTGKIMIDGQVYSSGASNVIQGTGNVITEKRKLNAFSKLDVNLAADVEYIASDDYRLELTADDNIAPVISSIVQNGRLVLDTDRSFSTQSRVRMRVYGTPALEVLRVDGSSDVGLHGLSGHSLRINLDGTGAINAQGKVRSLTVMVDGTGSVNSKDLQADHVRINVDGSADVTVTVNSELDVAIDGVSDVTYYGHPSSINKIIDGVGQVSQGN